MESTDHLAEEWRYPDDATSLDYKIASDICSIPFDSGMVVLDRASNRILAYNSSASFIWHRLEIGTPIAEVSQDLSEAFDIAVEKASAEVQAIIRHWEAERLLLTPEVHRASMASPLPRSPMIEPLNSAPAQSYSIGGLKIRISFADNQMAEHIRILLEAFVAEDGPAEINFSFTKSADAATILFEGDAEVIATSEPGLLIGALYQAILSRIRPEAKWQALIHGGGAALRNFGIGFPARSGSGKSTLVASLIANGFTYLADDLLAVTVDGMIVPWPMPLSIKSGSWDVLSDRHPNIHSAPEYGVKGLRARLLPQPSGSWQQEPIPLRLLVFPTYVDGAKAQLTRLSAMECLARLLNDRVWIGSSLDEIRVRQFLNWISSVPAFSLTYGDLEEAETMIRKLTVDPKDADV